MIPYPTSTLASKDLHRELRATGHFEAVRLTDVEAPIAWATFTTMWASNRCAAFRDTYDVAGFVAWYVADLNRARYCIPVPRKGCVSYRLSRFVKRTGVEPHPKAVRAAAKRSVTEEAVSSLVASAEHVTLDDGSSRILLDSSIVLGDLLAGKAAFVMFAFQEITVTLSRSKLVDVARAMRAFPDVRSYLHLDANVPQLRFWWRGGAGGLNLSHPFSFTDWNMKVNAEETTAVVFPVPCRYTPAAPVVEVVEVEAVKAQPEPVAVVAVVEPVAAAEEPVATEPPPPVSTKRVRRVCPVCEHANRGAIDRSLADGAAPSSLVALLGVDGYTARVHARDHLSADLAAERRSVRGKQAA